ncbi:MAG: helix-hairpin-helix domain-containing protein [Elusimicrobia bacterium]|nr:helix-hairpin-helix domain-containing protein [Elusimicrobiota bacterium]
MKKVTRPQDALELQQVPNIGPSIAEDLRGIGIKAPKDLKGKDPLALYERLNHATQAVHDPCVLDTLMSAVAFMDGKGAKPWWDFTPKRKAMLAKRKNS